MKVVIQRVSRSSVTIGGELAGVIGSGMLILLGIGVDDVAEDVEWLCGKIVNLRIFNDENGVMNRSITETGGDMLIISQFTLHASTKKGNRPSYIRAARPEQAIPLYQRFIDTIEQMLGKSVQRGRFGAMMEVALINDGPVTILIDSKNRE
jgi:D-tyrosyl-tRNA(Tyr) deacylase